MPRAARVCREPGCPEFEPCEQHGVRSDPRGSSAARGYDQRWNRYARSYRARHPRCRPCAARGINTPTEAVDHIRPVTGPADPGFYDPTNHQPICRSCHATKTRQEGRTAEHGPPRSATAAAPTRSAWVVA